MCYDLVVPFNPNTRKQQGVRKNFGGMGKLWNALSDWQRLLWDQEGARHLTRQRLGQRWPMAGWNYFVQVNQRRRNRGLATFDFSPEYLRRLEAVLSRALSWVGSARPLLGPALFLQASRKLLPANAAPPAVPAGLHPPG